jgi:hypothetical protein
MVGHGFFDKALIELGLYRLINRTIIVYFKYDPK